MLSLLPTRRVLLQTVAYTLVFIWAATPADARDMPESFADTIDELTPAVVNISTTQKIKPREQVEMQMEGMPEEFRDFFEHFMGPLPNDSGRKATSLGSGFIVDSDGYIVTNHHVVAQADEISVSLGDKDTFLAKVVGSDSKTDIALLKIDAGKKLPAVKWGDSEKARVGDWVLAIGNPFGFGKTVTAGIISARSRNINSGPFDDFIQTDAAINRGNSGGPMFDLDGEVIGINTAIFSPMGGGNIGIGFAVPSNMARPIIEQLKKTGRVDRGWLGVKIQTVTEELAESLGLDKPKGALVAEVMPDSPAEKTDLKTGDVIVKYDGRDIQEMRDLPRMVADTLPGTHVDIVVWREDREKKLTLVIGELKDENMQATNEETGDNKSRENMILGMELKPLNKRTREEYNISSDVDGLVIIAVDYTSAAAEHGLRRGDVVLEVNQEKAEHINTIKDAIFNARAARRSNILLLVRRGSDSLFVALPLDEEEEKGSN
ncbi:MAG: DegQ family serine endoprotease [Rickettsiales bacterium]|nr:DegQ family serine endoprotease [Rickettsiales bacterium]